MTWIDRAIELVSPRWAMERRAWRDFAASYKGGVPTRTSEGWPRSDGYQFGTSTERAHMASATDRAYQAYQNNPVARALIQTETDNVIGDGLNYQPETDSTDWNKEAVDRYYEWLDEACVRGGDVCNGIELQREIWTQSRVAGDIGWILVKADGPDRIASRIQVVRRENIATPDGQYTNSGIVDGIRFDAVGQPRSFWIRSVDENGKRDFREIAARDFVFMPHYAMPNQARGETCYMTIFDLLTHLDRYVDGVSLAAWMATVFGIVFKQGNSANQFRGLGLATNSQGQQQRAITLENGLVKYVGQADDVVQVDAKQPMQQTPEFIRAMYRMLGQPFDMPLEVIAKDMSTCTFASARIGLLPFYRSCRIKAARFGSRWSRTIRWWLSREAQRTDGDPKKWITPFPENYWKHSLLPNAWDYTDPVSEAQSDHLQMDMGTKSPQMVIAERGRDAEKILRERAEWEQKTRNLQRVNSTLTRHPQSGAGAQGDPQGHEWTPPADPSQRTPDQGNTNDQAQSDATATN